MRIFLLTIVQASDSNIETFEYKAENGIIADRTSQEDPQP